MALPYVDSPPFLRALDFVTEAYLGKVTGIEAELSSPARRGPTGTTAPRRKAGRCWTPWSTPWPGSPP